MYLPLASLTACWRGVVRVLSLTHCDHGVRLSAGSGQVKTYKPVSFGGQKAAPPSGVSAGPDPADMRPGRWTPCLPVPHRGTDPSSQTGGQQLAAGVVNGFTNLVIRETHHNFVEKITYIIIVWEICYSYISSCFDLLWRDC